MSFTLKNWTSQYEKQPEFQQVLTQWIEQKKVKDSDIPYLGLLTEPHHWQLMAETIKKIISTRSSYSESLKIIEICCDLILMGDSEFLSESQKTTDDLLTDIKRRRYPVTTARDDKAKKFFESLPWPFGSKFKFERRGDRSGVELKVFISSEADIIKMKSSLDRIQLLLKENHHE